MSNEQDYYFKQIAQANPQLLDSVSATGDLSELYFKMLNSGTAPSPYNLVTNIPWGPKIAGTGDSKLATNCDTVNNAYGDSWITHLWLASNGELDAPIISGHGGYTSTQLAALFSSEVFAYSPNVVIEDMGTNDTDATGATTIANLTSLLKLCRNAGAALVVTTLVPAGTAALGTPSSPAVTVVNTGGTFGIVSPQYRVTALNGVGETLASAAVTATISSGSTNSVSIEAAYVAGATGYKYYRSDDGGATWGLIGTNTASGTSWLPVRVFVDTNITKGVTVPVSDTTAVALSSITRAKILGINAAKKRFASNNGLVLVDFYSQVVDPTTGMWKTGYTRDGTHPTPQASKINGQYMWTQLKPYFRRRASIGSLDNADPANLYPSSTPNGLQLTGSGTAPTGWSPSANPATGSSTTRGTRTGHNGQAFIQTRTTHGNILGQGPWVTTIPGHVYGLQINSEVVGGDSDGCYFDVGFKWHNQSSGPLYAALANVASDYGPSKFQAIATAPPGATQLETVLNLGLGKGTLAGSEIWIVDLTAAGLV